MLQGATIRPLTPICSAAATPSGVWSRFGTETMTSKGSSSRPASARCSMSWPRVGSRSGSPNRVAPSHPGTKLRAFYEAEPELTHASVDVEPWWPTSSAP
jgi:hypothetical protein